MIHSQDASKLNITASPTGINFNAGNNSWFTAKITNSYKAQTIDPLGTAVDVWLHGWIAMPPTGEGLVLNEETTSGHGYISTILVNNVPDKILTPAVSISNVEMSPGTLVYIRVRCNHNQYQTLYECLLLGGAGMGVKSVQCVNNILVVTY